MAAKSIRRIVTGLDKSGKSKWTSDEKVKGSWGDEKTGFRVTDLWNIAKVPADANDETIPLPARSHGFPAGVLFRTVETPPKSIYKQHPSWIPKGANGKPININHKSVGMHVTDSVDFAIVLEGEVWCYLEHEDKPLKMKAGDMLIQRGTYHAWHNRGKKRCIMAFVLVGAAPMPKHEIKRPAGAAPLHPAAH